MLDHRKVVRDEQVGELQLVLEVHQQVDDLRLDRDVQRRNRLVPDDQVRIERERPGDADALALAAGELVRIGVHVPASEPDALEQRRDAILALPAFRYTVDMHGLADDRAGRHARIERGVGVLEDHLHPLPVGHHRGGVEAGNVFVFQPDRALGRLKQLQHRATDGGLAAAGLADETQRLAMFDPEAHAVHGIDMPPDPREDALVDRKMLLEAVHVEQRRAGIRRLGVHAVPPSRRSACQHATECPGR